MEKYITVNKNGHSIRAKIYYTDIKNVSRAVISCHGFGSNKDNRAIERFAEHVLKKHKDTLIMTYDAPSHGADVKKILHFSDCIAYLNILSEYIKERYKTEKLYGYSASFGAYTMLSSFLDSRKTFEKVVLRCPAISMYKIVTSHITDDSDKKALSRGRPIIAGFEKNIRIDQHFIDELKSNDLFDKDFSFISENILIIHGTSDEVASFDDSKAFAEKNSIPFISVDNADHRFRDPLKMDIAIKNTTEFLKL